MPIAPNYKPIQLVKGSSYNRILNVNWNLSVQSNFRVTSALVVQLIGQSTHF